MTWHRTGAQLLPEAIVVQITHAYMHQDALINQIILLHEATYILFQKRKQSHVVDYKHRVYIVQVYQLEKCKYIPIHDFRNYDYLYKHKLYVRCRTQAR